MRQLITARKIRRVTKSGQAAKNITTWKYESESTFFNPTFIVRNKKEII